MSAFRPSFKDKDIPLNDAERARMQDMKPVLRNGLMETGLHETNCIEPAYGFVDYLVENKFISIKELVYVASASSASITPRLRLMGSLSRSSWPLELP